MRSALATLAVLLLVELGAGCSAEDGSDTNPSSFEGVPWVLSAGIDVEGWEKVAPSASFDGERVGGSTGCNRYGASYTIDGDKLEIGEIAQTLIACTSPADAVERDYLAAFQRVDGWRTEDEELVLVDSGEAELLRFRAGMPEGSWLVTGLLRQSDKALVSPLAGTEITASLDEDGALAGSAGCNQYTTTYTAERGVIEITPRAVTEMLCTEPDGVMEQEVAYLDALSKAARYRVDAGSLELLDAGGTTIVVFQRA